MDKELIEELYDSIILEHSRHPRNKGTIPCGCSKEGKNASCGDHITLYTDVKNGVVNDIRFEGDGCAICISSCSLMTQAAKHQSIEDAKTLVNSFLTFITDGKELSEKYEPLHIYENVNNFPSRVKCVLLPWRTLEFLLNNSDMKNNSSVTTE